MFRSSNCYPGGRSIPPISAGWYRAPSPDPSDVDQFKHSAQAFMAPTLEMYHFLNLLAHSPDLAKEIKDAASKSEHKQVESLIHSSGVKTPIEVSYNPDGLVLTLKPGDAAACFAVRVSLCW